MNTLSDFEALLSWDAFHEVIKWEDRKKWTSEKPYPLGAPWLKKQIKRMTSKLNSPRYKNYGTRSKVQDEAEKQGVKIYPEPVFDFLTARLHDSVKEFLIACIKNYIDIPATPHKHMAIPRVKKEPCGEDLITSPCNLGPEWLRHFLGVLYDREKFIEITSPNEYFPFENRDHFVHSILVAAIGQVVLSAPIDDAARQAVEDELRKFYVKPVDLYLMETVKDLTCLVYGNKYKDFFENEASIEPWVELAWPAMAFWHDSGYDAATWFLLTFREFSHCETLKDIVENTDIIWNPLRKLNRLIGEEVSGAIKELLRRNSKGVGYHDMWYIDGWKEDKEKGSWGRCHALFSAYEFLTRFFSDSPPPIAAHLAVAIAEHHEQTDATLTEDSGLNDREFARRFVRNPMGEILSFADDVSGFSRPKLENVTIRKTKSGFGKISFSIDFNVHRLKISQPDGKRIQFFRGSKWEEAKMKTKKRALWGDFSEFEEKKDTDGLAKPHPEAMR